MACQKSETELTWSYTASSMHGRLGMSATASYSQVQPATNVYSQLQSTTASQVKLNMANHLRAVMVGQPAMDKHIHQSCHQGLVMSWPASQAQPWSDIDDQGISTTIASQKGELYWVSDFLVIIIWPCVDLVNLPWLELAVYVGNWPLKCMAG